MVLIAVVYPLPAVGGSGLWVVDLGSNNGTFVNGERLSKSKIESKRKALMVGDELQIGTTTLRAMAAIANRQKRTPSTVVDAEATGSGEVLAAEA